MQKYKINSQIIDLIEHWFGISSIQVKWNNTLSKSVKLSSGVRQGSLLSPLLFAAYVDILLTEIEKSKRGCFIKGQCLNSFLYADDLILISISIMDLQFLIERSCEILNSLDLQINFEKSVCLRIGMRFRVVCKEITINGHSIKWASEAKYLGIIIKAGVHFSCNWHSTKCIFLNR